MQKQIYIDLNVKKVIINIMMWSWTLILIYPALYGLFLTIASYIIAEYQNKLVDGCFLLLFCGLPLIISFAYVKHWLKHREVIKKIYINENQLVIDTKEGILGNIERHKLNINDIESINIELETRQGIRYSTRYCIKLNIVMKDNKEVYNINTLFDNGFEAFTSMINNKQYLPNLNYSVENNSDNRYLNQLETDIKNFVQNGAPIKLRKPVAINIFALVVQIMMILLSWYILILEIIMLH